LRTHFEQNSFCGVTLFGFIPLGGHTNHYTVDTFTQNSQDNSIDMVFNPAPIDMSVSDLEQTAFILGGVPESYGS
jgi:hypothetical protein